MWMQRLQRDALRRIDIPSYLLPRSINRDASLTSAISRGIRKGANSLERIGTTPRASDKDTRPGERHTTSPRSRLELERQSLPPRSLKRKWGKEKEPRSNISYESPQGVPYTTAGSEFLYGTFAVKAAIEANRRQLHRLYVWRGERNAQDVYDESILRVARSKRVPVQEVAGTWDKMMLKMSGQRPHNGYVLEASPVPKLPITALARMEEPGSDLSASVAPQSAEGEAINKIFEFEDNKVVLPRIGRLHRYPLLLWLDRVTDTGNLGAIVRTAYFFGVDAIIIPEHGTAPFGPVTVKASAGAAEHLPILLVKKELEFVKMSKEQGWKFFAAVAPQSVSTWRAENPGMSTVTNILDAAPCVLMVGNESEGLRAFMQRAADEPISVEGARKTSAIVDSLNVSVAAALLVARFFAPKERSPSATSIRTSQDSGVGKDSSEGMF